MRTIVKPSNKKISDTVSNYITGLYCRPEAYSVKSIVNQVEEHLRVKVSYSTIRRFVAEPKVQNLNKRHLKVLRQFQ